MRGRTASALLAVMQPTTPTLRKLQNLRRELRSDFPDLEPERVDEEVGLVAAELLAQARFDDFVPLLTNRHVRLRLQRADAPVAELYAV